MARKSSTEYFLTGFVLAAALIGWWLWQRQQDEQPAFAPGRSRSAPRARAPRREAPQGEVSRSEAPQDEAQRDETASDEAAADSLQEIRGIGDVYARRLREAGIRTFADLAALTPDEAHSLAEARPQADTADWIEQANELASS